MVAGIAGIAGGCSSGATPTQQLGASSTGTASPSSEYLALAQPVDTTQTAFKASRTAAELRITAGPFAAALQKWHSELGAFSWPATAQPAISTLENDIPPFVPGLNSLSSGNISYSEFVAVYGRLATSLSVAAAAARRALGLPPI